VSLLLISLLPTETEAHGYYYDGTLSAGFWVVIGVACAVGLVLIIMIIWWCCYPTKSMSEKGPSASSVKKSDGEIWGSPTAYDAAMLRVRWGLK